MYILAGVAKSSFVCTKRDGTTADRCWRQATHRRRIEASWNTCSRCSVGGRGRQRPVLTSFCADDGRCRPCRLRNTARPKTGTRRRTRGLVCRAPDEVAGPFSMAQLREEPTSSYCNQCHAMYTYFGRQISKRQESDIWWCVRVQLIRTQECVRLTIAESRRHGYAQQEVVATRSRRV
jgi:formate-dependent nitrite reductase cytochrome c552 subunit